MCMGQGQASHVIVCVQATKVLEGLLPDEPVPQYHQRRNHDPDTEEVPQVSVRMQVKTAGEWESSGKKRQSIESQPSNIIS